MFPDVHGSITLIGRLTEHELRDLDHRRALRAARRRHRTAGPDG